MLFNSCKRFVERVLHGKMLQAFNLLLNTHIHHNVPHVSYRVYLLHTSESARHVPRVKGPMLELTRCWQVISSESDSTASRKIFLHKGCVSLIHDYDSHQCPSHVRRLREGCIKAAQVERTGSFLAIWILLITFQCCVHSVAFGSRVGSYRRWHGAEANDSVNQYLGRYVTAVPLYPSRAVRLDGLPQA